MALQDDLLQLQTMLQSVATPQNERVIQRIYLNPTEKTFTTAESPCILLFPRANVVSRFTFGVEKRTTDIELQFLYCPVGQGNLTDSYYSILKYSENIMDAIYLHTLLNSTVNWALPKKPGLPIALPDAWAGQKWLGTQNMIQVVASRTLTVGN